MNSSGGPRYHISRIVIPPATLALLWPYVLAWIKDGSFCGICGKHWDPKRHGSLALVVIWSIKIVVASHDANTF